MSIFDDDPGGKPRRRKELHTCTPVIVLDDLGTKLDARAALAKLGAPTYRLETSPGNEQWGYVLDPPEQDRARVEALIECVIADQDITPSGVDPGMAGVTRLVRLPVGWNGKPRYGAGQGVPCVLREWAPERAFSLTEMAAGLDVDLTNAPNVAPRPPSKIAGPDHVLALLHDLGLVKGEFGEANFDITCPFVAEHTDGADTGTAYLSGGGFKCHHGHCEKRTRSEFVDALDAAAREQGLPTRTQRSFPELIELARLRECLADCAQPTLAEIRTLARLDDEDVDKVLDECPDKKLAKRLKARLSRARATVAGSEETSRAAAPIVPLPAGYQAPAPLENIRAQQKALFRAFLAETAPKAGP